MTNLKCFYQTKILYPTICFFRKITNNSALILTILATDILQSYCGNEAFLGYTIFDYNIR